MKQQLLAIALSILFSTHLSGQDCSFPAANNCDSAKFICGFALNNYWGSNYGYQGGWFPPDLFSCGITPHNPQFFQIVPCSDHLSLTVTSSNCNTGDGLQVGLAESCEGTIISCDPGFQGGANAPLLLSADVEPGEPYILIIDGYVGDECDFNIQVLEGMDVNPPVTSGVFQPGMILFQSLPCGPATLTVKLPVCQQTMSPGCSSGWTDFYVDSCLGIQWNLPPGVVIVSPDPNAFTITVQFTQQVTNGMVSVDFIHTCPGIDEDECAGCIPKCCTSPIPPIFISSPGSSYTYVPCEEAPAYCAGSLDEVSFNNGCSFGGFGWWQTAQWNWGGGPLCFSLENPNLYRVIACSGLSNLSFDVTNCEKNKGLEFALMQGQGCDELYPTGNCITLLEGQSGQFSTPFYYSPFEEFYIIVDGIDLDACDFNITKILNGGNGQSNCLADQVFIDDFSPGWPYYMVSFNVTHPDVTFVTGGPGSYQNGYFMSAPIPCGTPYSFQINTAGCTDTIAGNSPCYLPPDCQSFNSPAPLADSCHLAPYISGGCLDGYCGTNAGLTPDQPVAANDTIPVFENNGWLRIAPCEDSIAIDFQVFDCQTGDELGFFLLSGDCDSMTLISFISAKDGYVAQLTASGLTPGEVYYLAVDGFYDAQCKFQAHVLTGIGTGEPDSILCSNCTPSTITGPTDLCPGDFATYTFHPGGCDVTLVGGNGQYCPSPDLCKPDTAAVVLHWTIPPFMNFVSDSVDVYTITVQVDPGLIGFDTVLTGQVSAYWAPVAAPPDTTGGGNGIDDNVFCSCGWVSPDCVVPIIPLDVTVHHDVEEIPCVLTCVQPCCSYNGQSFCTPGTYIVEQTNCLTKKLIVTADAQLPVADAGPGGTLTCDNLSVTLQGSPGGPNFSYSWSGPGISPSNQSQQNVTVISPGVYNLTVTNTSNGCTSSDITVVTMDMAQPSVMIPPVPKVCYEDDVTLIANANPSFVQYAWSNGMAGQQITFPPGVTSSYTVTVTNNFNGCTGTATTTVQVLPPKQTFLPTKTICEGDCIYVNGEEFCSSGNFLVVAESYQGCDSFIYFSVIVKPYIITNHGTVGTLTCNATSITFMGNTYTQPGIYTVYPILNPGGCGEHIFTIDSDNNPPIVDAGLPQQICHGEAVTLAASSNLPGVQFLWSNGMSGSQITAAPTSTTTYTVTATDPQNGCTAASSVLVSVSPLIPPTNLPLITICEGDCVDLAGEMICPDASGNYSTVAQSHQGCDSTVLQTINVQPYVITNHGIVATLDCNVTSFSFMGNTYDQPGNYTLPDASGCGEHQFTIDWNNYTPYLEAGQPQEICAGQTATLVVSPIVQSVEYWWSNGATGPQIEVSPTTTTTYTVFAKDIYSGCMSLDQVTVTVNLPTDTDLGVLGTLNCAQPDISIFGNTYDQPGQYSVPKPGGCGNNLFVILADLTPPWCPMIPVPPLCAGESATLQTAPTNPAGLQYLWNTGETTQEITVTPLVTTNYTVTATDPANGCSSIVSTTVEVNEPQTVQLGIVGTLTCSQPCFIFNGQEYCQPGTYSVTENCEIKEFQIGEDLTLPTVQLGLVGTLTCAQPCFIFNGQEYCQPGTYSVTENCEIKEFQIGEDLTLPTVQLGLVGTLTCAQPCFTFNGQEYCQPGTYSVTENCEVKEFQIGEDLTLPTVQLGLVGTLTCAQPCFIFNGQEYCQPGTYSVTENCEIKEFQIGEDLTLPTVQLGLVGTLTCAQPCFTFNGQEYCQPGTYSVTENCEIKAFQIGEDLTLPTVQLGLVGTLTCAQPCFIFNGQEYCQPGTYSVTENCEIKEFQIGEDLTLPTVQLGLVGTLTCAQPCFTFNDQEYCQPGTYSVTENCEIKAFQIGEDLTLPTVQLGLIGTLTCAQPCFIFNGQEYCQPGTYSITENCEIKEFEIADLPPVWLELGTDQTIAAGESAELQAQTNAQAVNVSWYNSAGVMSETQLGITVQPAENTLYSLKIQDINGCLLEDSVWVFVQQPEGSWFAPNVIRPGATDLNGWFTLFASPDHVAEIQMLEIYDRWGNRVFGRKNFPPNAPEMGWDGTLNGKTFDPAVFAWYAVLLLNDGSTEHVKGDVTLLR